MHLAKHLQYFKKKKYWNSCSCCKKQNTPAEALAKLARKNNRDIKLLVIRHENTSRETLEFLFEQARDTDGEIFQAARKALVIW